LLSRSSLEEPEMRLSMRRTEGDIACIKASGVVGVGDRLERNAPESSRFQRNAHFFKSLEGCTWLQFFSGDFFVRKDPKAVIPH